jgi:hypothetical protein
MSGLAVQRLLAVPRTWPPTLVVVIDTEEEFDWTAPFDPTGGSVANIACQPLAQRIFDAYGVVPTYVVDYPVATTPAAAATLCGIAEAGRCAIGAHLHPWVTPPAEGPVDARHSYPCNLSPALERRKLEALTEAIVAGFGIRPVIYKAGRYGIGSATASILRALGYGMDVSVVPHTDFSAEGGPDFTALPDGPFVLAPGIVELPLSVHFAGLLSGAGRHLWPWLAHCPPRLHLGGLAARLGLLERLRLTPEGHGLADMLRQTRAALAEGTRLFMLTYHSATLLPGATAYAPGEAERDRFLATLEGYCRAFLGPLGGRAETVSGVATALGGGA